MPEIEEEVRPHWSYSSLSEYLICPLKFFFHRIEKCKPEFVSVNLVLGKALHAVYAQMMSLIYPKMTEPVSIEDMEGFFIQSFNDLQEEKINYNGKGYDEIIQKGKEYTRSIVKYLGEKKFNGEEVWIEKKFTVPLMENDHIFDLPLEGIFDLVVIDHDRQHADIIDFKTSTIRYPDWKTKRNLQMLAYTYGLEQLLGTDYRIVFRWEVLLKQKNPCFVEYQDLYDSKELQYFMKVVTAVERGIECAVFYPTPSFLCSYCEYFKNCRSWPAK